MRVILTPRAELDFEAQVKWLKLHSPNAGRKAATRIVEIIDLRLGADFPPMLDGYFSRKLENIAADRALGFAVFYKRLEQVTP